MNRSSRFSVLIVCIIGSLSAQDLKITDAQKLKVSQEAEKRAQEKKQAEEAVGAEKKIVSNKEEAAVTTKKIEEAKKSAQAAKITKTEKAKIAQAAEKQAQEKKQAEEAVGAEKKIVSSKEEAAVTTKKVEEAKKSAQAAEKQYEQNKKITEQVSVEQKMAKAKEAAALAAQEIAKTELATQAHEATLIPVSEKEKAAEETRKKEKATLLAEGIDTLEQEGGNWLLKRQALEKTVDLIEVINNYFTKILEARIDFLVKRNKTDHDWDVFINKIGFEVGDLQRLLINLSERFDQERKDIGDLTEDERAALTEIDSKIKEIKQLQEEIKTVTDLINSLDDVIMQLEEEVNIANTYQTNAWKNFQAIKKVLSDERAEELYLQTQGLLKNIQAVDIYLKGKLLEYFNSIIQKTKQETNNIENSISSLAEKGINLKDEVEFFLERDKKRDREHTKEEEKIAEAIKKVKQEKEKKEQSWFSWLANIWEYPVNLVSQLFAYGMSFFTTNEVVVVKKQPIKK